MMHAQSTRFFVVMYVCLQDQLILCSASRWLYGWVDVNVVAVPKVWAERLDWRFCSAYAASPQ
ncbi:MAG TPA: hypothetical protein ACQGQH_03050 [Xylella sp.]